MKSESVLFQEFSGVAEYSHPDARHLAPAYGWLAYLTFNDPNLGTYDEGMRFWTKAKEASARKEELYGKSMMGIEIMKLVQKYVAVSEVDPSKAAARRALDAAGNRNRPSASSTPPDGSVSARYACVACFKHRNVGGGPLMACSRCKLVRYCSKDCQRKDWKAHKQTCKMMAESRSSPVATLTETPAPIPVTQRLTSQTRLEGIEGEELGSQRVLQHILDRWAQHGAFFSSWWKSLSKPQKRKYLNEITGDTLPRKAATNDETKRMLSSGNSQFGAKVLTDYTMEFLLAPCQCTEHENHGGRDQVLCEIYWKAVKWTKESEHADYEFCRQMVQAGAFPDLRSGVLSFVKPPDPDQELQVHKFVKLTKNAPEEVTQQIKGLVEAGLLKEASLFSYSMSRWATRWGLFALLFEKFDMHERHILPSKPLARLNGCEHCTRSCEGGTALNCPVCTVVWWCCQGCKMASQHGSACPTGKASHTAILFQ